MKKFYTLLVAMFLLVQVQAQNIQFKPFAGYGFDDHLNYQNGSGTVKGGFIWGAGLEFMPSEEVGVELFYQHQDTKFDGFAGIVATPIDFDMGTNYLLLKGNWYFPVSSDKVKPYGGLGAGVGWFNNKSTSASLTKFSWDLHLGTKITPSPKIGIMLQAQLLSAVQAGGGSFYVVPGYVYTGVSSYSTLYQFGLTGGLVFSFGHK